MTTTRTPDRPPAPPAHDSAPQGAAPGSEGANGGGRPGLSIALKPGGYVLAIAALLVSGFSLAAAVPGRPAIAYLVAAALLDIFLVGGLILHEVGHALVARRHGVYVSDISLGLFGTTAHGQHDLEGARAQGQVAAAGPAASLALAAGLGAVAAGVATLGNDRLAFLVFAIAALGNAVLGILSLLPGAGPDGGRIVRALTWARTGDPARAGVVAARTGQVTGAVLAMAGAAVIALGYTVGLWLALLGILAFATSRSQARQLLIAASLTGLCVRDVLPPSRSARDTSPQSGVHAWLTVEAFIAGQAAGDDTDAPMPGDAGALGGAGDALGGAGDAEAAQNGSGLAGSGVTAFPLLDFDGRPAGLLTLRQLAAVPPARHDAVRLRDIGTPLAHVVTTTGDEPVATLLGRLSVWPRVPAAAHTAGHALVLHPDGTLAGVLTPADLARATQLGASRHRTPGAATAAHRS